MAAITSRRPRSHGRPLLLPSARLCLSDVPMILMYHGVAEVAEDPNQLCVTPSRFAEQMTWLKRRGLRGVGIGTLVDAMRAGRQRGLVGITFDDGYLSVLEAALPELLRHRLHGDHVHHLGPPGRVERMGRRPEVAADVCWPGRRARRRRHGDRLTQRHAPAAGRHRRRPARNRGQREQGEHRRACRRPDPGLRLSLWVHGCRRPGSAVRDAGYDYACAVQTPMSELGFMALPRIYVGQRDDVRRMAVKRLLFRGYIAVKGRRP